MVKISEKHSKSANSRERDLTETKFAKDLNLENFGWASGFYRSERKKITVTGLFSGFCKMQDEKENTLSKWALHTGISVGQTVSKQGLSNRLNEVGIELVKMILQHALSMKLHEYFEQEKIKNKRLFSKFNHILIQDSTMQKLPPELSEIFKSSYSHGRKAATLRLQAIYNFTTETWVDFELGGFTDNDQSKAMMITKVAQPKDLILRDLGYFTLESLEHLTDNQFVITSWDKKTHLFDVVSKNRIYLLQLFKGKRKIDQPVLIGSKKLLPMRLVAKKLPTEIAKDRIKKAKEDRNSKANHSKTYYELLKWEIYLTNVDAQTLSVNDVAKLYGLRWYIEILFKSWKSYACFKTILEKERMTYSRTVISIYLMLIRFVYFMLDIYHYIQHKVAKVTHRLISILKFLNVCRSLSDKIMNINLLRDLDPLIDHFARHATYEKRKDRLNMHEKYLYFNEL